MKNLLFILLIACFSYTLVVRANIPAFEKGANYAAKPKEKTEKNDSPQLDAVKSTLNSFNYEVLVKDFYLPKFEDKFFILFKTVSLHLDHKVLFKNRYYHTLLRHFISPQAP